MNPLHLSLPDFRKIKDDELLMLVKTLIVRLAAVESRLAKVEGRGVDE